jgi:hypothetical protein
MQLKYTLFLATGLLAGSALAYTVVQPDRRTMLKQSVASAMAFVPGVGSVLTVRGGAASAADDSAVDADGFITTESGLRYKVLKEGTGAIPQAGQTVKTHYTGTFDTVMFRSKNSREELADDFCPLTHVMASYYTQTHKKVGWTVSIRTRSLIQVAIAIVPLPFASGLDK